MTGIISTGQSLHQHIHQHHGHHQHILPTDSCYSSSAASSPLPQRVVISPDAGYYSPETTLNRSEQPVFESLQEHLPDSGVGFRRKQSHCDDPLPQEIPGANAYNDVVGEYHLGHVEESQADDSAYVETKSYFVPGSIAKRRPLSGSLLSLTTSSDRSDSSEIDWAVKLNNGWLLPLDLETVPLKIPFGAQRVPGAVPYRQLPVVKDASEVRRNTLASKGPSIIFRQQSKSGILGRSPSIDGMFARPSHHRDELSDLLDLYSSLCLEEDEDLLVRAERRDLPEGFQRSYRLPPTRRFSHPPKRTQNYKKAMDNDIIALTRLGERTPPSRRSAIPDLVLDDLATRRFSNQGRSLKV
ncbi:hypothetical protein BIW11_03185 [Tropilaelaps mercedesae]|uniref:Uncharacterized protein n=1 Tax=Tropilaelaps mercedesae TaxID=418985 RepID=A0A1V9XQU8_9ACAR|nr:hypothetical protein BIW11_03185 [Tropilaelaps mercedesae]